MTLRQRADIAQCMPIMKMTEGSPSRVVSHGGSGVCGESTIQGCEGALCACCAPVQMVAPHGCQSMSLTESTCPRSTWRQRPRARSHSLCARREGGGQTLPGGVAACSRCSWQPVHTPCDWVVCLVPAQAGPCTSWSLHSTPAHRTLWSRLQLASQSPWSWCFTDHTACLWSDSVIIQRCRSKLHSLMLPSPDADARLMPPGWKSTPATQSR